MTPNYYPALISLFPLAAAFLMIYHERKWFKSLFFLGVSTGLLFLARLCDVTVQIPSRMLADLLHMEKPVLNQLLINASDLIDTAAVFLIVLGFVQTIRFERRKEERIRKLELLLPICAWCKKYRTEEGAWQPIDTYLEEKGASLTHGICPTCADKVFPAPVKPG